MKIFDISRALSNDLAPWPGDTRFHFELKWKMVEGATVNVGAVNMGVHNGTHADATFHFDEGGDSIERMPLEAYVGEAVVADLTKLFAFEGDGIDTTRSHLTNHQREKRPAAAPHLNPLPEGEEDALRQVRDLSKRRAIDEMASRQIGVADLEAFSDPLEKAPRLLLKTGVWRDSNFFPDWIPVIAPDVPAWLGKRKVRLLGLDLPSVDPIEAKKLTNHYALAAARIAIVESLDLSEVEAGVYHFAALPLKIVGGDAGPVRAILWRD